MKRDANLLALFALGAAMLATLFFAARTSQSAAVAPAPQPRHRVPASPRGNLMVGLCDGETSLEVQGVKEGETLGPAQARAVADMLMTDWRRKNPHKTWVLAKATEAPLPPSGSGAAVTTTGETSTMGAHGAPAAEAAHTQAGNTYGNFSERDREVWALSTEAFIQRGKHVFHDVKELGGTTGISCDMCHPDAANTHPETYPKFQVQLGRVALLRDMINWCIENPVRGKALPDGDERLRALEAYIYSQRRGIALQYGKH